MKVLTIARVEYLQSVRSKAFLVAVFLMPILMGGGVLVQLALEGRVDLRDRRCAVVDPDGELFGVLAAAAEVRNAQAIWEEDEAGERRQTRPRFLLERFAPVEGERADVALSRRVEAGELQGFLLLGPGLFGEGAPAPAYHTEEPTFTELCDWLETVVNQEVRRRRFEEADVDPVLVDRLDRRLSFTTWGLVDERPDGTIEEAEEENELRTWGIPFVSMMLLFMLVMTSAPQLMNQVLEEKMQRISEVLVSCVSPFQLMLGKLVGTVAISLTLAALYLGGVRWATHHWGVSHFVPLDVYLWFLLLLVFTLLMYGSLFSALGAACSELRDAQGMMMPAMILVLIPLFAWSAVLESPNGTLAQVLTYVPTATPMILLMRVLAPPGPPLWEIPCALLMCLATTIALVWAAAKIFRIGVLAQGQTPTFRKLVGWVLSK